MFKKIVIVITCILVVGLVVFLDGVSEQQQKHDQNHEKIEDAKRPLLVKKQGLEKELEELEKAYESDKAGKATTQVVFTGLEPEVYTLCYPIMKEHEYTGTLALSLNQFPGMEGFMTTEQFRELVSAGWDICIKWDAQTFAQAGWKKLQKQLEDLEMETGSVLYFPAETYSKDIDKEIQELGFSIVLHHGEEGAALIQLADEEGIWHLGAVGLMGEKPKLRLTEAISQKGNITYLVGFELEEEKFEERSFRSMLSYFGKHETNQELAVIDFEEARQYYRERSAAYEQTKEEEYQKAKAALEEQLAAVEAELAELKVK